MPELSPYEKRLIDEYFPDFAQKEKALERLNSHEPLAYIIGEWGFYDQMYRVTPDCLIPRADTEHIVDKAIELLPKNGKILDLCTGSGCIAISTLAHRKECNGTLLDISQKALKIAKENAEKNGVSERTDFICADLAAFNPEPCSYDIITANPPYIKSSVIDTLQPEIFYEPRIALDGGDDGLNFYRIIIKRYRNALKPGGKMIFEIGYDQAEALISLGATKIFRDYGGNDRVAILEF